MVSAFICSRDDPSVSIIRGITAGFTEASQQLYKTIACSSGFFAEYIAAPLETVFQLDEARILGSPEAGSLGYVPGELKETYPGAVETVQLTGDAGADGASIKASGPVDVVVDVSPPEATGALNFAAAISSLGDGGRIMFIGARGEESLPISYLNAIINSWTIKGSYIYAREDIKAVLRLTKAGLLKLGKSGGHDKAVETGALICIKP